MGQDETKLIAAFTSKMRVLATNSCAADVCPLLAFSLALNKCLARWRPHFCTIQAWCIICCRWREKSALLSNDRCVRWWCRSRVGLWSAKLQSFGSKFRADWGCSARLAFRHFLLLLEQLQFFLHRSIRQHSTFASFSTNRCFLPRLSSRKWSNHFWRYS